MDPRRHLLPLPKLPNFSFLSPNIVTFLDKVRRNEDYGEEFFWFAMEYPRIFRYHLGHAEHRLRGMYEVYEKAHKHIAEEIAQSASFEIVESSWFNPDIAVLYWDFEAFLNAISASLDILARIASIAHRLPSPSNFNKYLKRTKGPIAERMHEANERWVRRFKDYRDCFVHYTPIDRLPMMVAVSYSDGVEIRCRLPINPNARENIYFRYNRRTEMLRYSIFIYKSLCALERSITGTLEHLYAKNEFPIRTSGLFGVSSRRRVDEPLAK